LQSKKAFIILYNCVIKYNILVMKAFQRTFKISLAVTIFLLGVLYLHQANAQTATNDLPAEQATVSRHHVKIAPLGLLLKLRVQYEKSLSSRFSAGAIFTNHYSYMNFSGLRVEPFLRLYPGGHSFDGIPVGFYLQGKVSYGRLRVVTERIEDPVAQTVEIVSRKGFNSFGVGGAVGYQTMLHKKSRITLDVMGGLQAYSKPEWVDQYNKRVGWEGGSSEWALTAGAILNPSITLGKAF
jgi:hypothetical protein